MVSRSEFYIWLVAVAFFASLLFGIVFVRQVNSDSGFDWLATVQEVGQTGSTVQYVERKMGNPGKVYKANELGTPTYSGSSWVIPSGTKKVLYYEAGLFPGWMVYFFVGSDDKVLGYSLRST